MTKATKPRTSGFCNPTLPRTDLYDPHQRCPGCDCRAPRCPCNPEDPMPETHTATLPETVPETAPPGSPEDAVAEARSAADALNAALRGYDPDDWRDAVRLLAGLRKVTATLGALDATLVHWLYLHGEHGIHLHVEGVAGDVSITRGRAKERWAGPEAVNDYVESKIIATDGEAPDPRQVVEWVLEVLPTAKCRVTPLRDAGLDVGDYRTSEPGNLQVGLPSPGLT